MWNSSRSSLQGSAEQGVHDRAPMLDFNREEVQKSSRKSVQASWGQSSLAVKVPEDFQTSSGQSSLAEKVPENFQASLTRSVLIS
jgi:hypothetical protein